MIPLIVILIYLAIVAYVGSVAYRRGKSSTEDFFLANAISGLGLHDGWFDVAAVGEVGAIGTLASREDHAAFLLGDFDVA